jgi:hypothetical protein
MYKTHRRLELTLAAFGLLGLTVPQAISAQTRALAVVGGAWQYDLSGTGTSGFGGLRLELPVSRTFLIEPGLTYASYSTQFDQGVSYLLPEVQAQLQIPGKWIRPFVGGGVGLSYAWASGTSATDLTLSGGVGLRGRLTEMWSARGELRVRAIDPSHGSVAEWTLGLARRF